MISYDIPEKMQNELRKLSNQMAQINVTLEKLGQDEKDFLKRHALIANVGASTRIENAILTNVEIQWIDTCLSKDAKTTFFAENREWIQDKLSKDKERSIDEVVGCRAMLTHILQEAKAWHPLRDVELRGLHEELLQYYEPARPYRGSYKSAPNKVVLRTPEKDFPVLVPADHGVQTQLAMRALLDWYNQAAVKHPWTLAVAVEFVFRFLAIHPFQDGNGRLGRGLLYLTLLQGTDDSMAGAVPYLTIDRYIERERETYYRVLRKGSAGRFLEDATQYNYHPFLGFMLKVMRSAVGDFDFYRERYKSFQALSDGARSVLACFKDYPELRLQTKWIVKQTHLARRTVNDALVILQKKRFIQRYGQGAGIRYQLLF